MKILILILLFIALFAQNNRFTSNRFVYLNPGQRNVISVSPLSIQQAQSLNTYTGTGGNYQYNWQNLPSWATSNGSTFYGVVPQGLSGTQPITVQYVDQNGNAGSFSFTLNYGGVNSASSTAGSGAGSFNIINGVTASGLSLTGSDNAQIILIPNSVQTQIQTTTQVTSNSQVTTAGDGAGCSSALNDLNNANNMLSSNTNGFVAINNELNNANNTLINLKLNQTTITTQLQQYTLQANVSNSNVTSITNSITSLKNNITAIQNQMATLTGRIQQ